MQKMSIIIRAEWDAEAKVYVATSDDVPGLITEAPTPERLIEKLGALVPELLALNDTGVGDVAARTEREIPMYVVHQHTSRVRIYA